MQAKIVRFLRSIPQSNQIAQPIKSIAEDIDPAILLGFALMLKTIGVVKIDDEQNIQASSQTAKYMLHSIASFVESNERWIEDWHTRGINPGHNGNTLQNAATLLHMLETRRLQVFENPKPSRSEEVAQVLIKRTNPKTQKSELLFQFDSNANQFQLIGGRRSNKDVSLLATIIREIDEEVASPIVYSKDYNLNCIVDDLVPSATLSPTFGALTEYHFSVYHMTDVSIEIETRPEDEWVPIEDMLAGHVLLSNDVIVPFNASEIYHLINELVPGGLLKLPDSFRTTHE